MFVQINEIAGAAMVAAGLLWAAFGYAKWRIVAERRRTAEILDSFGITVNTIRRGQ